MTDLHKIRRGMETLVEKLKSHRITIRHSERLLSDYRERNLAAHVRILQHEEVLRKLQTLARINPESAVQILASSLLLTETGRRVFLESGESND